MPNTTGSAPGPAPVRPPSGTHALLVADTRRMCRTRTAVWESAALHHPHLVDRQWSSRGGDGRWCLTGELDAHAVPRFGAALYGALRARRDAPDGPDLDVDLSEVTFLDFACAQSLTLTARAAGRHQRLVLHGVGPFTRRIIEVAGRPSSLHFAGE